MKPKIRASYERCGTTFTHDKSTFVHGYGCASCEGCAISMDEVCPNCDKLVRWPRRRSHNPGTSR